MIRLLSDVASAIGLAIAFVAAAFLTVIAAFVGIVLQVVATIIVYGFCALFLISMGFVVIWMSIADIVSPRTPPRVQWSRTRKPRND